MGDHVFLCLVGTWIRVNAGKCTLFSDASQTSHSLLIVSTTCQGVKWKLLFEMRHWSWVAPCWLGAALL